METLHLFSPATIANISCGFDVLGLALSGIGDEMRIRKVPEKGVRITRITGQSLPMETEKNVAGVAAMALLNDLDAPVGFEIEIDKRIKPGSGIGSSAASAAGAVWGINYLLGSPYKTEALVPFAMEGERLASGAAHADNVAPALFGGITLVRSYDPLDVIGIPVPEQLFATIIHPQIEIKTADARELLKTKIPLQDAIRQWGNVGGLISGLYTEDYALISRSLQDHIVEPIRSLLIPAFDQLKKASLAAGALGAGISGSGPSVFALSKGKDTAHKVSAAMETVYKGLGIAYETHVSTINREGIQLLT